VLEESKGIKKGGQDRKNFVKINMKKNYKPSVRGGVYNAKMMVKKKNSLKFREVQQRKI
jgi:hypothetical protein